MDNIKERIEKSQKIAGFSNRKEFANFVDVSYPTMNRWIERDNIPSNGIIKITKKIDISQKYLETGKGNPELDEVEIAYKKLINFSKSLANEQSHPIPVIFGEILDGHTRISGFKSIVSREIQRLVGNAMLNTKEVSISMNMTLSSYFNAMKEYLDFPKSSIMGFINLLRIKDILVDENKYPELVNYCTKNGIEYKLRYKIAQSFEQKENMEELKLKFNRPSSSVKKQISKTQGIIDPLKVNEFSNESTIEMLDNMPASYNLATSLQASNMVQIPYFKETYASAGKGIINYDEVPTPISFDKNFLKERFGISSFKNTHLINASGDSMTPTFKDGEMLMINPFENEGSSIRDGSVYAVSVHDTIFVKRMNYNPITREMTLKSDNKDFDDIFISKEHIESCTIIGRVVGHFDRL